METRKFKGLAIVLAASMAMFVGGCGDDDGGDKDAGVTKDSGPVDPGPATTAMCLQMAKDTNSQAPQATIDCLCDKCLTQMDACNKAPGCVEIRDCSDKTGCRGTGCYFFTPECMKIIDRLGSTGLDVTLATQLNDCNDMMCMGGSKKDAGTDAAVGTDSGSEDAGN